jgi:hypothetical protein
MVLTAENEPELSIGQIVRRILTSKQMKRQEHLYLTSMILSNRTLTEEERRQINRVLDHLMVGRLKLVD